MENLLGKSRVLEQPTRCGLVKKEVATVAVAECFWTRGPAGTLMPRSVLRRSRRF